MEIAVAPPEKWPICQSFDKSNGSLPFPSESLGPLSGGAKIYKNSHFYKAIYYFLEGLA